MLISMESAFYISSICSFLGLIFMIIYAYKKDAKENCASCFIGFFSLSIISEIMIASRAFLGTFLSVVVANLLTVVAVLFINRGISKITKTKFSLKLVGLSLTVFIILFSIFTYAYNSILIRIVIVSIFHITIIILAFIKLQKSKVKFSLTDEFMSPLFLFYALIFILRIIFNLVYVDNNPDFLSYTIDPIFVLFVGITKLMFLSGILSLYNNNFVSKFIESERKLSSLISNLPGFAYRCLNDEHWTMLYVSHQVFAITGYKPKELINNYHKSYEQIILEEYRKIVRSNIESSIKKNSLFIFEYMIRKKDGSTCWVREQANFILEADKTCKYIEGFIMDVTERKEALNHLEELSYIDSLTKLYNRRHMEKKLISIRENGNYPITLIMGDINGLKFINDTFGHAYGDRVLQYVGNSIINVVKDKEMVSRISGDEFIIMLENTDEEKAEKIINLIEDEVYKNNPFNYDVSISLGASTANNKKQFVSKTRRAAEDNMYRQKIYAKPSNQRKTIDAVLKTLHEKDRLSEEHSYNVSKYAKGLAKKMMFKSHELDLVETAALLHDVGKIIIPQNILLSTEKLTEEEYNEIKKHPEIGYRILNSVPELNEIAKITLYHHERMDGKGYPKGVVGKDIPLISRIISICDAYDAMVNQRLYRKSLTKEAAIKELIDNKGTQFDSELIDLFVENINEIT